MVVEELDHEYNALMVGAFEKIYPFEFVIVQAVVAAAMIAGLVKIPLSQETAAQPDVAHHRV